MGLLDAPLRKPVFGRLHVFGHSYTQFGSPTDKLGVNRLASALGNSPSQNYGIGGSILIHGDVSSSLSSGGFNAVMQRYFLNTNFAGDYASPPPGLVVYLTGLNDSSNMAGQSAPNQVIYNQIYEHAVRACIAYTASSIFYDVTTAFPSLSINTTFGGSGSWSSVPNTTYSQGTGYRTNASSGSTVSHAITLGRDRYVDIFFLGAASSSSVNASSMSFTLDGNTVYPVGYSAVRAFDMSLVKPSLGLSYQTPWIGVARFLIPAGTHTLVATAGTGGQTPCGITFEADWFPPTVWNGIGRTPSTTAPQLTAIQTLNTTTEAVIEEFNSSNIAYVDLDLILEQGDTKYWTTTIDTVHPNEWGNLAIAKADKKAFDRMPLTQNALANLGGGQDRPFFNPVAAVATTNQTTTGGATIDGVTVATGDRVLLTAQTNTLLNGIWIVQSGTSWKRPIDFIDGINVRGQSVMVYSGTVYSGTTWQVSGTGYSIVGKTAQAWVRTGGMNTPSSSTDNAVVRWDGTGGRTLQDSAVIIGDSGSITQNMGTDGQTVSTSIGGFPAIGFYNDQGDTQPSTLFGASGYFGAGPGGSSALDVAIVRSAAGIFSLGAYKLQTSTNPTVADDLARKGYIDSGTTTLTNKRITKRVVSVTQSATPTSNTDNADVLSITGLAQAVTNMSTNQTGTPVDGDQLLWRITDNGTARALTWGTLYEASGTVALPTTTVISTMLVVGFIWNTATSKWRCVAVA